MAFEFAHSHNTQLAHLEDKMLTGQTHININLYIKNSMLKVFQYLTGGSPNKAHCVSISYNYSSF